MIFKCGCKSVVGHDSEGDATLTLEHCPTHQHAEEMRDGLENMREQLIEYVHTPGMKAGEALQGIRSTVYELLTLIEK